VPEYERDAVRPEQSDEEDALSAADPPDEKREVHCWEHDRGPETEGFDAFDQTGPEANEPRPGVDAVQPHPELPGSRTGSCDERGVT
jgi:hypothetical protein